MKIRHLLLVLFVILSIAFMQPLIAFLGGLAILIGVGVFIFRDLPPASQDIIERRLVNWLRQTRSKPVIEAIENTDIEQPRRRTQNLSKASEKAVVRKEK